MPVDVTFYDQCGGVPGGSLQDELLRGLRSSPKVVSPKFFYDRQGSELFDRICQQPEYYPTRVEEGILSEAVAEIARIVGPGACLIELGSGVSRKVRLLLETLQPTRYAGVDISRDFLLASTRRLAKDYPWLEVHAICADFSHQMVLPDGLRSERCVMFFPGSSIGNFSPAEAEAFLHRLHALLPPGSGLLIGVDLIKATATLEAAYNDAAGVTADFNRHLIERLRDEFGADALPENFTHLAFYDEAQSRIEMHLVSRSNQQVVVAGECFHFEEGERLHTENSYKYSIEGFRELASRAGFRARALWRDSQALFSVHYFERQ